MCKPNKKAKRSILIIEDDRLQMKMLASLLETEDLEPICCRTGREALTASQQQSVNVAILDLQLPDMDGVELLKQLKAQNPHIKIIINTGYPTLESAMAAVNHEAFAYVQKMGNVEELLTHVHRAFHRHLADYSEVLEGQVKDQTDELLETNQELRKEITERKQAEAALARRAEEMAALYETSLEINAQLDPKNLLQSIVQRAATLLNTEMGGVFLLQPDGETLKLVVAHNQSEEYLGATMRLGEGLAGRIAQTGDVLSVPDYRQWEDRANVPCAEVIGRILGVPLKHGDQVMGVITVFDEEAGTFDQNQIRLLRLFAAQAAVAVENTRLFDETYRRARQLAILNELAGEMAGLLDTEELCETVVQRMFLKFEYFNVAILSLDAAAGDLVLQAIAGAYASKITPGEYRQFLGKGIIGKAATTGEMIRVDDSQQHPDFYQLPGTSIRSELAAPLRVSNRVIGVLVVASEQVGTFDESDVATLMTIADQLAVALEKARLFEETRWWAEQLEELHQVSKDLSMLRDLDTLLYQVVERAMRLLTSDTGGIYLYRPEQDALEWRVALGKDLPPVGMIVERGEGVAGKVWDTGEAVIVDDYQRWPGRSPQWSQFPTSGAIGVPIQWGDEFLGVLTQGDRTERRYTTEDAKLLAQFANHAAVAIRNARFYAEIQKRLEEQTALRQAGAAISATLDLETVLNHIAEQLTHAIETTSTYICNYDSKTSTATVVGEYIGSYASPDERVSDLGVTYEILRDFPNSIELLQTGRPGIMHTDDPDLSESERAHMQQYGAKSVLFIPMQIGGQTNAYALLWESRRRREFTTEEIGLCQALAQQAAIAIENARLHGETQKQARRVKQILDTVQDGILLLDKEHLVQLANPAARSYLNLLANVSEGEVLTHLGEKSLAEILGSHQNGSWHEVPTSGSSQRLFEIAIQPIRIGPETEGWVLVLRDVTEQREIQQRVQRQDRLAAVGQLAAGIAHDFNNILTGIIGYAELIGTDSTISQAANRDLGLIIRQSERAARLVRQILDFSRRSIIEKRPIELSMFLRETVKLLERTIPEDIRIFLDIEPARQTYMLQGDPAQLQQALTNLALNARDAMPQGGEIRFRLSELHLDPGDQPPCPDMEAGDWIVLSIIDTGTGIQPTHMIHLFEPFFTTKEVGEGTGLGLAQVYGIVKQHDGYVDVESDLQQGATFTIYLPALPALTKAVSPKPSAEISLGQGEVILLVEDDETVLEVTKSMLEQLGYQVVAAVDGRQALDVFKQHKDEIALVLTDVTMPEIGGVALAQALHRQNPNIKVVALTGYPLETDAQAILKSGIVNWLQKPISLKELSRIVSQSLANCRFGLGLSEILGQTGGISPKVCIRSWPVAWSWGSGR